MAPRPSELLRAAGARSVSFVVPAYDEADNIDRMIELTAAVGESLGDDWQIVVVDDASTDDTARRVRAHARDEPRIVLHRNERNLGCHPSELVGFSIASGDAIFFMPADLQIRPEAVIQCLPALAGADLVCTRRARRADGVHRRWISGCYNALVRRALGVSIRDVDSSILVRRTVVERILPEIDAKSAFVSAEIVARTLAHGYRVAEADIDHYPRVGGRAKGINLHDLIHVPLDLLRSWRHLRAIRSGVSGG